MFLAASQQEPPQHRVPAQQWWQTQHLHWQLPHLKLRRHEIRGHKILPARHKYACNLQTKVSLQTLFSTDLFAISISVLPLYREKQIAKCSTLTDVFQSRSGKSLSFDVDDNVSRLRIVVLFPLITPQLDQGSTPDSSRTEWILYRNDQNCNFSCNSPSACWRVFTSWKTDKMVHPSWQSGCTVYHKFHKSRVRSIIILMILSEVANQIMIWGNYLVTDWKTRRQRF